MATVLHLIVPGLLGPWLFHRADPAFPTPAVPALEWLLSRAHIAAAPASTEATVCQLFGLTTDSETDLPIAALTRWADGSEVDDGWWWRADPVHFHADLNGVILADARTLAIQPEEAHALVTAFNQTFGEDGLRLDPLRPDRWYLRLAAEPDVKTHSLALATGRDIRRLLPYGPAKGQWHKLLTEVQMLFYTHPVNRAREAAHQPLISGIWLWGGGRYPTDIATLHQEAMGNSAKPSHEQQATRLPAAKLGHYANDPLTRGLARWANVGINPVPDDAADWFAAASDETDSLVMLELMRYDALDGDSTAWSQHVVELEQHWFKFCQQRLKTGQLTAVALYPGNGRRYRVTQHARWQFWKYAKPLSAYLG